MKNSQMRNRELKKDFGHINEKLSIFGEEKKAKLTAIQVLEKAKQQEKEKFSQGFAYVSIDAKTKILKNK